MLVGMLLTLAFEPRYRALYRASRLVRPCGGLQCAAMLASQLAQLVAIVATESLLAVTIAYGAQRSC